MATNRRKAKPKRVAKARVARTRNSGTMTEAAFFGWIRSQLRRMSQRWKPIYETRREGRRYATAEERARFGRPRLVYVNTCQQCNEWFPCDDLEVDHLIPCGSLGSTPEVFASEAGGWILRLLVERVGLRRLCVPCHVKVTHGT